MKALYFLIITVLSLPCGAAAIDHRIECPLEIPMKAISITAAPAGWTPFLPFEYRNGMQLTSAGMMWGPPSSMSMAKPSFTGKVHGKNTERWDAPGTAADEKWMACYYGKDGYPDAIMSQRLPDSATQCVVTYPREKSDKRLDIMCKW
ncbi:MAG: hypothetical protein QFF03_16030 [Pseudomonadota bacterium]|nr:hypothetical protein [Pseudomonadota bacterium]